MNMEPLQTLTPLTWLILASALIIIGLALFTKALKFALKLAVIGVMLLLIAYFMRQSGLL